MFLTAINNGEKISLYERRRRLITVLYERQNDTIGNLAFEFSVSSHTIRNDIRVLELEYPIYTKMGAGGGVFILDSSRLVTAMVDGTSTGTTYGCMRYFWTMSKL